MDISLNAKVYCQDKRYGHVRAVILNPESDVITHLVVKESKTPHSERLVPIDMIDASLTDNIHLKLNARNLQSLPPFFDMNYVRTTIPHYVQMSDIAYRDPIVLREKKLAEEKIYHIPINELAVNRGSLVYSADGNAIGNVDEFLVDENTGRITRLVLRKGPIFSQKDVFIPVAEIKSFKENSLRLKLKNGTVEKLPALPIRRFWVWA